MLFFVLYCYCPAASTSEWGAILAIPHVAGIFAKDWKKANIVPIHKKVINKLFQNTDQSLFYQYVVKSLKS